MRMKTRYHTMDVKLNFKNEEERKAYEEYEFKTFLKFAPLIPIFIPVFGFLGAVIFLILLHSITYMLPLIIGIGFIWAIVKLLDID